MRRLLALIGLLALVPLAGCGGSDGKAASTTANPTAQALAHVPNNAPVVALMATDMSAPAGGRAQALLDRFAGARLALPIVSAMLEQRTGVSLEDLRPLAGNDAAVYLDPAAPVRTKRIHGHVRRYVVPSLAWVAKDAGRLSAVVAKAKLLRKTGERDGATLYATKHGGAVALYGPLLLAAPTPALLNQALKRDARTALTPAAFTARLKPLDPTGALVRVIGDARAGLLRAHPQASRVRYVRALRRFAATITPAADGVHARLHVTTDPTGLTDADVPLATGVQPPAPRGRGAVVAAVRDPAHALLFLHRALTAAGAGPISDITTALKRYAGVDVDRDILGQLTGTATLTTTDLRHVTLRAEAADPVRVDDTLDRLSKLSSLAPLAGLAGIDLHGFDVDDKGDGRYAIKQDGKVLAIAGVRRNLLIVSTDPHLDLDAVAAAPAPRKLAPAEGALRATVDVRSIATAMIARLRLPRAAQLALAPLGALTVTAHAERDGIDATAFLPVTP